MECYTYTVFNGVFFLKIRCCLMVLMRTPQMAQKRKKKEGPRFTMASLFVGSAASASFTVHYCLLLLEKERNRRWVWSSDIGGGGGILFVVVVVVVVGLSELALDLASQDIVVYTPQSSHLRSFSFLLRGESIFLTGIILSQLMSFFFCSWLQLHFFIN